MIRHPCENSRLQSGDVQVAPSTEPGWTPLFLRAKALVMEVGGYLSHGAIVAREYGIPSVVNVPGVMKTLHDGEPLTVDGMKGRFTADEKTLLRCSIHAWWIVQSRGTCAVWSELFLLFWICWNVPKYSISRKNPLS